MNVHDIIRCNITPIIIKLFVKYDLWKLLNICELVYGDKSKLHLHPTVQCNNTLFNLHSGEIWMGENSFCGHNVMMITGKHFRDDHTLLQFGAVKDGQDIHIGKRVWICSGAIILGDVAVGDDSIIAAGAIVTKDVPANSFVKGVW